MSSKVHYLPETLRRFVSGRLDEAIVDRLRHHLQSGCESCRRRLSQALVSTRSEDAQRYAEAFSKAHQWLDGQRLNLARERLTAPELAHRLSDLNVGQQRLLLANQPQFRTWGLCERLLADAASSVWNGDLTLCAHRARTAVLVAEHLQPERYSVQRVQDLRAEAYGRLGNAHRMAAEYPAAERCFRTAHQLLTEGCGEPEAAFDLACLEISLETNRGRWDQGWEKLNAVLASWPADGDPELLNRLLVQRGVSRVMEDPQDALTAYRHVLSRNPRDPYLRGVAQRGLALSLTLADRLDEAASLLDRLRQTGDQASATDRVYDPWLLGLLLHRQGRSCEAVSPLHLAITRAQGDKAAPPRLMLLHLDLAAALTASGEHRPALTVAKQVAARLTEWRASANLHRGWALIQRRISERSFDASFKDRAYRFSWRAWGTPGLTLEA